MGRLDGKVCISTSGIGRDTVDLFVKEGAKVLFCGRGKDVGEEIASNNGENCIFMQADVTKEEDIKAIFDKTLEQWGKLDCLFNNAGGNVGSFTIETASVDVLRRNMQLNFESMCLCMKYAIPHLKKQRTSCIISNSSIAGKRPGFGSALYSATKSAMDAYMRVAAMELAKFGIRVNNVSPGAIATPIFWGGSPGSARGKKLSAEDNEVRMKKVQDNIMKNVTPLRVGRAGLGIDIATMVLFLASDEGVWITGQDLTVDGGLSVFDHSNKGWMADDGADSPKGKL